MSVKKKTPGGRSGKAVVEASESAQSAAERRVAETQLNALIEKLAPADVRLISAMRRALRKRLPTTNEVGYEYENLGAVVISYSPSEHGYEGVLAIRGSAEGVKFYFNQGKDLPDPEKLLKGSSQTRFIHVEGASTLARPPVARLIEEAIARNTVPIASAGSGSIIIRSTSAKKPRPSKPAGAVSGISKTPKSTAKKKK